MLAQPRPMRLYSDTSVFGGCFDTAFDRSSRRLFEDVRAGLYRLIVSDVTLRELERSPDAVQRVFLELPDVQVERVLLSSESLTLRDEYLSAGVLAVRWIDDAAHVALATVARADALVSWNFRHLVHLERIRQFNAVNLRLGYPLIEIRSPRELVHEPETD